MDKPTIKVNYGLGSSYESFIEINHKLFAQQHDALRESVIKHERDHRNGKYNMHDFMLDFQAKQSNFKESIKFCIHNDESWIGFFPLMYSYYAKAWSYNSSALYPFLYFGMIFSGFFWLLFRINVIKSFIGYILFFLIIQGILLAYTHHLVKKDKGFVYKEVKG